MKIIFISKIRTIVTKITKLILRVTNHQKSGCFRSNTGAYCNDRIASVIETSKKQGVKILDALSPNFSFV